MDLREVLSHNKNNEFIWSLVIEPGWVQAGIWTISDGVANVIALSAAVSWDSDEELVATCDTALSSAVGELPEDAKDPNKVVFGVSASWVESGQIKKEKLEILHNLCKKLTLSPAGFVTLPEAISFYIKSKEGSPLTAVLVSPGKELTEVSIFRLGNLLGTTFVAKSVSLFDDVVDGISRFNLKDAIPSRFILFDGKEAELEEAKQSLLQSSWADLTKIKILHTPKMEILTGADKVEAVALGGATEIAQVSKVNIIANPSSPKEEAIPQEAQNVGFVVNKDITTSPPQEEFPQEENTVPGTNSILVRIKNLLISAGSIASGGSKGLFLGVLAIVLVVVGLFAYWWFATRATVTIFVSPQKLEEKIPIVVDVNASDVDATKNILPGRIVTTKEDGDKTMQTTGTKLVGDKAKGEVQIRNGRSDELKLTAGTTLVASNSLEFEVSEATVVSAQTAPGEPGTGNVKVVASDIGSEFNLAKDERFKVANYPKAEVDAVATADLTGGSSRQIQAVSESDRKEVLTELQKELENKAAEGIKNSLSGDDYFIDGSVTSTVDTQAYSGKNGDEAESLKLTLSLNVQAVVVSKDSLFKLANGVLKEKVPKGYVLREAQVDYSFELRKDSDKQADTFELDGDINANLLPEINVDNIATAIVGKTPSVAEDYLRNISGFSSAQIVIHPHFPGKLYSLPRIRKNISVEIAAE